MTDEEGEEMLERPHINTDLSKENIPGKIQLYKRLFEDLFYKTNQTKQRLDMYQACLHKKNTVIQLSVIYLSAISSFLQALSSKTYEIIFPEPTTDAITNVTDITTDITTEGHIDQSTYSKMVPIMTLSITTYCSLIIAGARHLKIEEREGNIGNLRDRFAELVSRIKYQIDVLRPWEKVDYYNQDTSNDKIHEWVTLLKRIDKEYIHIVDIRKELYVNYNKLVNTAVYHRYKDKIPHEERNAT